MSKSICSLLNTIINYYDAAQMTISGGGWTNIYDYFYSVQRTAPKQLKQNVTANCCMIARAAS